MGNCFRLSLFLLCLTTSLAAGQGLIVVDKIILPPPLESPPIIPEHPKYGHFAPLQLKHHKVQVDIRHQVATTSVDQIFHNPSSQRLEGTYLFPVPRGAQIDRFAMDINGKPAEAELLDADKARQIYEQIVRRAQDPALMEYVGQRLYKVRIFPIEPHRDKHITLKYTQVLPRDRDLVEYLYGLNTTKFSSQPIHEISMKVELESSHRIKNVYCPTHEVEITRHGEYKAVVGFDLHRARPDRDFQLFYSTESRAHIGINVLAYHGHDLPGKKAEDGFFMLLASPGKVTNVKIVDKDIIFVLDTSGSMAGDKLKQAQRALKFCLANLNPGDRFDVIRFSTEAEPLFEEFVAADDKNIKQANHFIDKLKAMGGTAIQEALLKADQMAARSAEGGQRPGLIIFLTDGRPTIGQRNEDKIVASLKRASNRSRIFCFGIGTDINTHLLDKITEKTRAYSQYVLPDEDIEIKVSRFYAKISQPVLADIKLTFEGAARISKIHPVYLPDLFVDDQLLVFGRFSGHGDLALALEGTVNNEVRQFTYEISLPKPELAQEHEFIARLWATRRVGHLLDQIRLHGDSKELRDEVTQLARQYGLVTPYTSYLILEDEEHRDVPLARRSGFGGFGRLSLSSDAFLELQQRRSGQSAVHSARSNVRFKRADSLESQRTAESIASMVVANDAAFAGYGEKSTPIFKQITRYVGGRTFFFRGTEWVDSAIQAEPHAPVVEISFNSDEYFDLVTTDPKVAAWLSIDRRVKFLRHGRIHIVK